ncbi:MAG: NADH-quinone oxidoreductase subunit N [Chloroflexota bacterium]
MYGIGIGSLGSVLPEIILLIGGLLVLLLDMAQNSETYQKETGRGFMAITVLFLFVGLLGVLLQWNMNEHSSFDMVDIDPIGAFFKVIIYTGMLLVAVAGGGYMNRHAPVNGKAEFWSLFLFVTLAMSMAVSATNLILLFLSFEFLSITSYILAGFMRENERSSEAGLKYFLYGSVASAVMLYGMSWLYGATGSVNLREIASILVDNEASVVVLPAIMLILVGLGFKMSLAPFFQWAPDTYDGAPTPVTAYLSTASKTVGFGIALRVFLIGFGQAQAEWVPLMAGLAILTMSIGNLMALRQSSVKRMLAYSSVAQAGYILMGLAAVVSTSSIDGAQASLDDLGMNGINGILIYLFAYLFTNVGAFMVVLAVEEDTGGDHDISAYNGLMQRSPALAVAMLIFMLSLTGIPLTGGFWGKFYVFGAAIQHQYWYLAIAGFINAGIAAGYYLRVVAAMIFTAKEGQEETELAETPAMPLAIPVQLIVSICAIVTVWIGIYPPNFIDWADDASRQFLALLF